jgi:hypothetical protein
MERELEGERERERERGRERANEKESILELAKVQELTKTYQDSDLSVCFSACLSGISKNQTDRQWRSQACT